MESKVFAAIPWVVFLPGAGALLAAIFARAWGGRFAVAVTTAAIVSSLGASLYSLWFLFGETDPAVVYFYDLYSFVQTRFLDIRVAFQFDRLSGLAVLGVTGAGSVVHFISLRRRRGAPGAARYFACLNLFAFSLLLLVLGRNLLVMFAGWGGVGLSSYLLMATETEEMSRARAAQWAFIIGRIGDFAFLIAFMLLVVYNQGSIDLASLQEWAGSGVAPVLNPTNMNAICLLFILGTAGKLAQVPFCVPALASAEGRWWGGGVVHAAALIFAGIYPVTRLSFLFDHAPWARTAAVVLAGLFLLWLVYRIWLRGPVARFAGVLRRAPGGPAAGKTADGVVGTRMGRTLRRVARFCNRAVDAVLIDLFVVQGPARGVRLLGFIPRALHNGDVQGYMLAAVVGLACLWIVL